MSSVAADSSKASTATPPPSVGLPATTTAITPTSNTRLVLKINQKILILGDYETGKTNHARFILDRMKRSLVWDPTFAFPGGSRSWEEVKAAFVKTGKAVYWPGRGNLPAKLDAFCEFALTQHSAMILIDEPAMVGHASALPQSFMDLHRLGHKRGLGFTLATHSVWDLPHVTHQANHVFAYRIGRVVDLNVLKQILGEGGSEWVKNAPQYHFWHRSADHEGPMRPIPKAGTLPVQQGAAPMPAPAGNPAKTQPVENVSSATQK